MALTNTWSLNFVLLWDRAHNNSSFQDYRRLPDQGSARGSPLLGDTSKRTHRQTESMPAHTSKCGGTDKSGSVAPDQLVTKHISNSEYKYQVQHEYQIITMHSILT